MFMKRAPEPELSHFYDGSAALFFFGRSKNGGLTVRLHCCLSQLTLVTDHNMEIGRLVSLACLGHVYCLSWEVLILQMYKVS